MKWIILLLALAVIYKIISDKKMQSEEDNQLEDLQENRQEQKVEATVQVQPEENKKDKKGPTLNEIITEAESRTCKASAGNKNGGPEHIKEKTGEKIIRN